MKSTVVDENLSTNATRVLFQRKTTSGRVVHKISKVDKVKVYDGKNDLNIAHINTSWIRTTQPHHNAYQENQKMINAKIK